MCAATISFDTAKHNPDELFDPIKKVLFETGCVFNFAGKLVRLKPGHPMIVLTSTNLPGILSEVAHIDYLKNSVHQKTGLLSSKDASAFLHKESVREFFLEVNHVTRTPFFDSQWRLVNVPGYDATAKTFFDGLRIEPSNQKLFLNRLVKEFSWKTDADKTNYIGSLLTQVTMNHYIGRHPLLVFNGNKPQVGKTTAADIVAILGDGQLSKPIRFHGDDELERQVGGLVYQGSNVVVIDNAALDKGATELKSQFLEKTITASIITFRLTRTHRMPAIPNNVTFCLTMNGARLGRDLRARSLPINLELAGDPSDRKFEIEDIRTWALENRNGLLAELCGAVNIWIEAGCRIPEIHAKHSVGFPWSKTIHGILEANNYRGFLSNFSESEKEYDGKYEVIAELVEKLGHLNPKTPGEWAKSITKAGLDDLFPSVKSERGLETAFALLVRDYQGKTIETSSGNFEVQISEGRKSHRSKKYWFSRLTRQVNTFEAEAQKEPFICQKSPRKASNIPSNYSEQGTSENKPGIHSKEIQELLRQFHNEEPTEAPICKGSSLVPNSYEEEHRNEIGSSNVSDGSPEVEKIIG